MGSDRKYCISDELVFANPHAHVSNTDQWLARSVNEMMGPLARP